METPVEDKQQPDLPQETASLFRFEPSAYQVAWVAASSANDQIFHLTPTLALFELDDAPDKGKKALFHFWEDREIPEPGWTADHNLTHGHFPMAAFDSILAWIQSDKPVEVVVKQQAKRKFVSLETSRVSRSPGPKLS